MTDTTRNPWEIERHRTLDTALHDFRDQPSHRHALALLSEGYTYHGDDMIGGATLRESVVPPVRDWLRDVTAADRSPMATVVVIERDSPYPPAYPSPLIYTVPRDLLDQTEQLMLHIAQQRAEDFGVEDMPTEILAQIAAGLELQFAFAGEPMTLADWRG